MDAEYLEKEYEPVFVQNDIVNLPKYQIYLKLMIDGIAGDAFSATVLPPIFIEDTKENEEKIIAASREHYASNKADVEDKIARWSGMLPPEKFAPAASAAPAQPAPQVIQQPRPAVYAEESAQAQPQAPQQTQVQQAEPVTVENPDDYAVPEPKPDRPLFSAICDMCADEIQVPFKPDGKRPTFCKECLKDYQRMAAKSKLADERNRAREGSSTASQTAANSNNTFPQPRQAEAPRVEQQTRVQRPSAPQKTVSLKSYAPKDRPMTLSQLSNVAPKKFKSERKRPEVNLSEVRNLIKNSQNPTVEPEDEDVELDRKDIGR
jgi:CxxC-x17-CxxC domain-containing protein